MNDELYKKGMQIRRSVLGDPHVDKAEANKQILTGLPGLYYQQCMGCCMELTRVDKKRKKFNYDRIACSTGA
jgi:hypothetical protein